MRSPRATQAADVLRHALAGGAAAAAAAMVAEALLLTFGDAADVHAVLALAFAAGTMFAARVTAGRFAWLRPAATGVFTLVAMFAIHRLTTGIVSGSLSLGAFGRLAICASCMLASGACFGLAMGIPAERRTSAAAAALACSSIAIIGFELAIVRNAGRELAVLVNAFIAFLPCAFGRPRAPSGARATLPGASLAPLPATDPRIVALELGIGAAVGVFLEGARTTLREIFAASPENRAFVYSAVAFALAAAVVAGKQLRMSRGRILLTAALLATLSLFLFPELATFAQQRWALAQSAAGRGVIKLVVVLAFVGPTVFAFGVAALGARKSTHALAHLVLGTALGCLATRILLSPALPSAIVVATSPVVAALLGLLSLRRYRRIDAAALLALTALLVPAAVRFPDLALTSGALDVFASRNESSVLAAEPLRKGGEALTMLHDSRGIERLRGAGHDGVVAVGRHTSAAEILSAVIPALYTKERKRALVLGGTASIAAGAASRMFAEVVLVEPNPLGDAVAARYAGHNFAVTSRTNVVHAGRDAFVALASSDRRYDAIVSAAPVLRDVSASKVVTTELLSLAKLRLSPGGVVAFGFDDSLPVAGLAVVLRTASDNFAECHFAYLGLHRYELVCGDQLAPQPPDAWADEVMAKLAPLTAELGARRFLESLILLPEQFHGDWFPVPNTFELPVLDHVMAREDNHSRAWDLDLALHFDLAWGAFGGDSFTGPGVFDRCLALALVGNGKALPRCATLLRAATQRSRAPRAQARDGLPLPAEFLALSADVHIRNAPGILPGITLLSELVYAGQEQRAKQVVAARAKRGVLTPSEAHYAREQQLF